MHGLAASGGAGDLDLGRGLRLHGLLGPALGELRPELVRRGRLERAGLRRLPPLEQHAEAETAEEERNKTLHARRCYSAASSRHARRTVFPEAVPRRRGRFSPWEGREHSG